ncbi:Chromatin structure-remodeling complex subunit rsc7 [Cyphellophora attinorum]|uniref:Chromatin structure-remodeling complex subunit rsc7 n=1 Tax=Cyphellophora attinorum TaxID=1664694 RepID=A0A0N0NL44_9EURO|nr:Chromatin structure-remodeling complex subunit rsc7 [Phialophora attinorum]KPI38871.1 Chromatin structure-remodeling complex subunit rsc7 [Phialophora attinorum]
MSIYSTTHQPTNGVAQMSDGTIDPSALNPLTGNAIDPSSRGLKRSRSPDPGYGDYLHTGDDDDTKPRKRGRPPKTPRTSGDYTSHADSLPTPASQISPDLSQTPHMKSQGLPSGSGSQTSPPRTTPQKPTTLKALPTVRDHTTDQLGPEGDEYVARDFDENGEKKVDTMGYLQGGRDYKIRTFKLPGRGEKLFMLATECARTLQYRDSYLLFNKNRSLFKIIASPKEKEQLVQEEILPYSYRSRQIAVVTARSMFRQFGSRVIKDGRRVRDDYWEAKAIKQGFTEDDPAGEKRPGQTRAREAAAAAQAQELSARQLSAYGDVVYTSVGQYGPMGFHSMAPQMGIIPSFDYTHDPKYRDVQRPRQDLTGPPYMDLTRPSSEAEMAGQSTHAADFSRTINQQAKYRRNIVQEYWQRPHDPPVTTPPPEGTDVNTARDFSASHPFGADGTSNDLSVTQAPSNTATTQAMNPPSFAMPTNPLQSPSRQPSMGSTYGRDNASQFNTPQHQQFQRSSSNLSMSSQTPGGMPQYAGNFSPHTSQQQAAAHSSWGGPPSQPPLHRMSSGQYAAMNQNQMPSPAMSGHPSPHAAANQMQPPQMAMMQGQTQNMGGQHLIGPGMGLQAMNAGNYPGLNPMARQQANMYGGGMNQRSSCSSSNKVSRDNKGGHSSSRVRVLVNNGLTAARRMGLRSQTGMTARRMG